MITDFTTQTRTCRIPPTCRGFTLIEILVALLVLSLGLIGLAMLQATGLRYNNESYMRSQAARQQERGRCR